MYVKHSPAFTVTGCGCPHCQSRALDALQRGMDELTTRVAAITDPLDELAASRQRVKELETTLASREAALREIRDVAVEGIGAHWEETPDQLDRIADRAAQEVGR